MEGHDVMDNTKEIQRVLRLTAVVLPIAMIGGVIATATVVVSDLRSNAASYATLTPEDVRDVQFLALPDATLADAVQDACAVTGCDARVLHPMITASAANMTGSELKSAIDAQARILIESQVTRDSVPSGSKAAQLADLEIAAATRIADLYRSELRTR